MAPQAVDAIRLLYTSRYHLGIVHRREIVWDIKHDIAYDTTDRGQRIGRDVFERVFVGRRILELKVFGVIDI
jgi:hypothetical protein